MTDNVSKLVITFEYPGSAIFKAEIENVSPIQLLAVASYLEYEGKQLLQLQKFNEYEQLKRREQMSQIIVPGK